MKTEKKLKIVKGVVKVFIPASFFLIANVNDIIIANATAGVLFIATIFVYIIESQEKKM